jgi:hypothetical protein
MTTLITRRLVLIALPAASAANAFPVAASETTSPAQRLFQEWNQAIAAEQAAYDAEESEEYCAQLGQARTALEDRLMNAPSQCPRDLLCKIAAYTNFGLFALPESVGQTRIWDEARALIGAA